MQLLSVYFRIRARSSWTCGPFFLFLPLLLLEILENFAFFLNLLAINSVVCACVRACVLAVIFIFVDNGRLQFHAALFFYLFIFL